MRVLFLGFRGSIEEVLEVPGGFNGNGGSSKDTGGGALSS